MTHTAGISASQPLIFRYYFPMVSAKITEFRFSQSNNTDIIKTGKVVLMSVFCSNGSFSAKDIDNLCGIVYIVTIDRKLPAETHMDKDMHYFMQFHKYDRSKIWKHILKI